MIEFHTHVFPPELIDRRQDLIDRDTAFTSLTHSLLTYQPSSGALSQPSRRLPSNGNTPINTSTPIPEATVSLPQCNSLLRQVHNRGYNWEWLGRVGVRTLHIEPGSR